MTPVIRFTRPALGPGLLAAVVVIGACAVSWKMTRGVAFASPAETVVRVGVVPQGQTLIHRFAVVNVGTAPLTLGPIEASCGCTAMLLSSTAIEAGKTGHIDVTVTTGLDDGLINRTVSIKTNDPRRRTLVLAIEADVRPEFTVTERLIDFGGVSGAKPVSRVLEIERVFGNAAVHSVTSTDALVDARLEPTSPSSVRVVAVRRTTTHAGQHWGNLVLATTSAAMPEIRIPIRGVSVDMKQGPSTR
ncbi:MAG: DUF1573 domain-containing protein [Acidobacteriota bacterium]|nr:DUF1573 domain-containing protein [Acidobacteriota bacterium]